MPIIFAIVRIRSLIDRNSKIRLTARYLRLTRTNTCTLFPESPQLKGMLDAVSTIATFGEINKETLVELLKKRGRIAGNKPLTLEFINKYGYSSFEQIAEEIIKTGKFPSFIKPVFRLSPPRKGFKRSLKKFYAEGGELGYRNGDINELILRMI
jgi:large subunit ribosomal protein L30